MSRRMFRYRLSLAQWARFLGWGWPLALGGLAALGYGLRNDTPFRLPEVFLGLLFLLYAVPSWWEFGKALRRARRGWVEIAEEGLRREDPTEPAPERRVEVPWGCILELSRYRLGWGREHWAFTYRRQDGEVGVVHVEPEGLVGRKEVWRALVERTGLTLLASARSGECYARLGLSEEEQWRTTS